MILEAVHRWLVSEAQVATTEHALSRAGRQGFELFVLWTGVVSDATFQVNHVHVPRQTSYQEEEGLHVRVDGDELHKLNVWLYEHGEALGVQIHTHPAEAFHSDTDDAFPMVTMLGGLSIVVPDFCRDGLGCSGTTVYRLTSGSGWVLQSPSSIQRLLAGRAL